MDRYSISELRMYYGALLSDRQNEMLKLHYDEDISYGELSEIFGISRQAAFDAVKKGTAVLESYESKLNLLERDAMVLEYLDKLDQNVGADSEESKKILKEIKRLLEE